MGGDGGTLAVKRAYLRGEGRDKDRSRQNAEKAASAEQRAIALRRCSLSGEPLRAPVVCCELGNLYNKEAVLQRLVEGPPLEDAFSHIKMKEMINCVLTPNPAFASSQKSHSSASSSSSTSTTRSGAETATSATDTKGAAAAAATAAATATATAANSLTFWSDTDAGPAAFICPVTQLEMNGNHPFVCLYPSGRVLSNKALTEVPETREGERIIPLNPSSEERATLLESLLARRKEAKLERKKSKKSKKRIASGNPEKDENAEMEKKRKS